MKLTLGDLYDRSACDLGIEAFRRHCNNEVPLIQNCSVCSGKERKIDTKKGKFKISKENWKNKELKLLSDDEKAEFDDEAFPDWDNFKFGIDD